MRKHFSITSQSLLRQALADLGGEALLELRWREVID
jgi:hypothetical protein